MALRAHADMAEKRATTLTFLGCGKMGTAILTGLLDRTLREQLEKTSTSGLRSCPTTTSRLSALARDSDAQVEPPTRFIACVRNVNSIKRIEDAVSRFSPRSANVEILQNQNLKGIQAAEVVILACRPDKATELLGEKGMPQMLQGKLLVSICGGLSIDQISHALYGMPYMEVQSQVPDACAICRAMPNMAALVLESMTVIATSTPPLRDHHRHLVDYIFSAVGTVVHIPTALMDVSTALCGSGPAFFAFWVDAFVASAVRRGLSKSDALSIAVQTMKGTASLLLDGRDPAHVKDKVCTPGGASMVGVLELEASDIGDVVDRTIEKTAFTASQLSLKLSE